MFRRPRWSNPFSAFSRFVFLFLPSRRRVAVREADPELAAACQSFSNRENKKGHGGTSRPDVMGRLGGQGGIDEGDEDWVGSCDAVLSNDSDFLVMDIRG